MAHPVTIVRHLRRWCHGDDAQQTSEPGNSKQKTRFRTCVSCIGSLTLSISTCGSTYWYAPAHLIIKPRLIRHRPQRTDFVLMHLPITGSWLSRFPPPSQPVDLDAQFHPHRIEQFSKPSMNSDADIQIKRLRKLLKCLHTPQFGFGRFAIPRFDLL
jgi:hypothetical protein